MTAVRIDVPRLNANEDQVLVASVHVANGAAVRKGDLLFVLETTKASSEVEAPASGVIGDLSVGKGAMADVGGLLCMILAEGADAGAQDNRNASSTGVGAAKRATAKAKLRAAELGVSVDEMPAGSSAITVADVERFAAGRTVSVKPVAASVPERPSSQRAVIVGGGGHAAIVADALQGMGYELVGATDPVLPAGTQVIGGLSVLGSDEILDRLWDEGVRIAFIGVGGATDNGPRRKVFEMLTKKGFFLPHIVSQSANLGQGTALGAATYVMPGAVVGPRCRIGANVIVNTGSTVCHDSVIHDHAHVTPGAILAGTVTIGESATIGMGATVLFNTRVGAYSLVHNNASVIGDVGDRIEVSRDGSRTPRGEGSKKGQRS